MKEKNIYLWKKIGMLLLMIIVINSLVFLGSYLLEKGEEQYNRFCISKGNEKFLSIDSGHIKCYRNDKLASYEDYQKNWNYDIGRILSILFIVNVMWMIMIPSLIFEYVNYDK